MRQPEIFHVGDDALAVRASDRAARHALAAALRATGVWCDVVPGKDEVTVHFDPRRLQPAEAWHLLLEQAAKASPVEENVTKVVTLHMLSTEAVAPDLNRIAAENDLTAAVFLERISASPLIVDMMGFTAGFAYISGVDAALSAPRLDVPRQKVTAGSVGMISGQLGLYALSGPAGWPIIGQIVEPLFDARRDAPFMLEAGMRIQLVLEKP